MSALLAGLSILVIGDSHMATNGYLISGLHDELSRAGAAVYSYGACGVPAGAWMTRSASFCGGAVRIGNGAVEELTGAAAATTPLPELVRRHKPDLVVVVAGDTMAGYGQNAMPKNWIWQQVTTLSKGIASAGVGCVWVGPPWGSEGGRFAKTYARVREVSDFLSGNVAPCIYVDSLAMAAPGAWKTIDGQHLDGAGYRAWGSAIAAAIESPAVFTRIRK